MIYAKPLMCKVGFSFPWSRNVFSACFVRSVGTGNAKEFRGITVLFGKRLISNINPESRVF